MNKQTTKKICVNACHCCLVSDSRAGTHCRAGPQNGITKKAEYQEGKVKNSCLVAQGW